MVMNARAALSWIITFQIAPINTPKRMERPTLYALRTRSRIHDSIICGRYQIRYSRCSRRPRRAGQREYLNFVNETDTIRECDGSRALIKYQRVEIDRAVLTICTLKSNCLSFFTEMKNIALRKFNIIRTLRARFVRTSRQSRIFNPLNSSNWSSMISLSKKFLRAIAQSNTPIFSNIVLESATFDRWPSFSRETPDGDFTPS